MEAGPGRTPGKSGTALEGKAPDAGRTRDLDPDAGAAVAGSSAARARRRLLLATSGGAAGLLLAGCAATGIGSSRPVGAFPFTLGVASGYPSPDSVVLWTRLAPDAGEDGPLPATVGVVWEVADDEAMRHVVATGRVDATDAGAHSVHVELAGLAPARWYWYRFRALGHRSRTGRTRTLPDSGSALRQLRLCIASCQHREHGFFAAYRHLLADQPDLVVHLGDYIYEGTWGSDLVRPLRLPEARTLADYRTLHALYKRDPDLQTAHAMLPWVVIWDDHEVANDYAGAGAERIVPAAAFLERRAAAYQAYFEHMPMPRRMAPSGPDMRIHTTLQVGSLATLYLLDQRQYRSPQACPLPGRGGGTRVVAARCESLQDPARTLLGREQERWLDGSFARSTTRWNLLAQQTLMAPLSIPASDGGPARIRTDGWDGYPVSRQRLLDSLVGSGLRNPVVLGGDLHAFYVADLQAAPAAAGLPATAGMPAVASEFVGTSITSQAADQRYYDQLRLTNPHIHHADGTQRGYLRMTLTADRLQADLMGIDDPRQVDSGVSRQAAFVVEAGRPGPIPG